MEQYEVRLPSVAEYVTAFRAIEPRIKPKQREMLLAHHAAPARVISATRLAKDMQFENDGAVNLQYGLLAAELAGHLPSELPHPVSLGILVEFVDPGFAAKEHYLWVLRPHVAQALEELGWAPRVSHLLYPESALATASRQAL